MCKTCTEIDKSIRWSKDSFTHILHVLGALVSSGRLMELGEVTPGGAFLLLRYKCKECNTIWRLTHPDQSMKGGFIRE